METMSELYDTEDLPERTFPLTFKLIDPYLREDPIRTDKLNSSEYIKGYFRGGRNTIKLVTNNDKIVIPHLLQRYCKVEVDSSLSAQYVNMIGPLAKLIRASYSFKIVLRYFGKV